MEKILVPRINANEDSYVLQKHYVGEKQKIEKDALIADLSSSKSVVQITSEVAGFVHLMIKEQQEVFIGDTIALIFECIEEFQTYLECEAKESIKEDNVKNYKLTKLAKEFLEENSFTEQELLALNKKLIKKTDLEELLKNKALSNVKYLPLSQRQKRVAKTVTDSHKNIPTAFLLIKVDCTKAQSRFMELTQEFGTIIGFGEILTVILNEIFLEFPNFFSSLTDDDQIKIPEKPNIGVTIDTGNGLFIPVVKSEQAGSVQNVADVLLEYKMNAFRGEFTETQLSGGTISISLNTEDDVVAVIPIIMPTQVAMISVGAIMKELAFAQEDTNVIVEKKYINLGISYDHRVINGFEAMKFMNKIKQKIEMLDLNIYT